MIVVQSIHELDLPRHGVTGLVPTMGALHEGHGALFRAARKAAAWPSWSAPIVGTSPTTPSRGRARSAAIVSTSSI